MNFFDAQVNQDIWYDYVATCTGLLTLSTCNAADYDTRLAAYVDTACPVTEKSLPAYSQMSRFSIRVKVVPGANPPGK